MQKKSCSTRNRVKSGRSATLLSCLSCLLLRQPPCFAVRRSADKIVVAPRKARALCKINNESRRKQNAPRKKRLKSSGLASQSEENARKLTRVAILRYGYAGGGGWCSWWPMAWRIAKPRTGRPNAAEIHFHLLLSAALRSAISHIAAYETEVGTFSKRV